jgi:hypothetical protein
MASIRRCIVNAAEKSGASWVPRIRSARTPRRVARNAGRLHPMKNAEYARTLTALATLPMSRLRPARFPKYLRACDERLLIPDLEITGRSSMSIGGARGSSSGPQSESQKARRYRDRSRCRTRGTPAIFEIDGREYIVFCAAARVITHPCHPQAIHIAGRDAWRIHRVCSTETAIATTYRRHDRDSSFTQRLRIEEVFRPSNRWKDRRNNA